MKHLEFKILNFKFENLQNKNRYVISLKSRLLPAVNITQGSFSISILYILPVSSESESNIEYWSIFFFSCMRTLPDQNFTFIESDISIWTRYAWYLNFARRNRLGDLLTWQHITWTPNLRFYCSHYDIITIFMCIFEMWARDLGAELAGSMGWNVGIWFGVMRTALQIYLVQRCRVPTWSQTCRRLNTLFRNNVS